MNSKFNIGVIGHGFIGQALVHGFILHANIKIHDKYKSGLDSFDDVVNNSDIIFLCLPTPMIKETGDYDLSILDEVISKISQTENFKDKVLVTKSTVLPGTNRMFAAKYGVNIVSNPEFLTARSNRLDFINSSRVVLGGDEKDTSKVKDLYIHRFGNSTNIYTTSWEAAELTKLTANCFFALKVLYFNTIYDVCNEVGVNYDEVKDMVLADGRIGRSHCDVPGHDKFMFNGQVQRGVSGHCLVAGTKILTKSGYKNIEDITTDDFVFDGSGLTPVTRVGDRVVNEICTIKSRGIVVSGSTDHIHMVIDNGEVKERLLKDIKCGDWLYIPKPTFNYDDNTDIGIKHEQHYLKEFRDGWATAVDSIGTESKRTTVYTIETGSGLYTANMMLTHNCFPKDMNAFMNYMKGINVDDSILRSAWDLNLKYRPSKDWENLGPSVVVSKKDNQNE